MLEDEAGLVLDDDTGVLLEDEAGLLLDVEAECTLDGVLELDLELTVGWALDEMLVAELDCEALLDEDDTWVDEDKVVCTELETVVWIDEVT